MSTLTPRNGLTKPSGSDIGFASITNANMDIIDGSISKCNFYSTSAPTASDDSTKGYSVGSLWVKSNSDVYVCVSPTAGAAVWRKIYPADVVAHHTTHESGGSDAIKLDDLAAPDDNTDLNVSTSKHGLCPKAPNNAFQALLGNGAWGYPLPDGWIPAGETWTYASADSPTFTFTISGDKTTKYYPGMRLKLTHSYTTKYFIVTKVSYSSPNTTVTIYGGTDYSLASGAITNPYYSMMKAPAGFPLDPSKWTVQLVDANLKDQSNPTSETWYNVGSLSLTIPIGAWRVYFFSDSQIMLSTSQEFTLLTTLSTTNNGCSDTDFMVMSYANALSGIVTPHSKEKFLKLSGKTVYYLNLKYWANTAATHLYVNGEGGPTIIKAVCAYL